MKNKRTSAAFVAMVVTVSIFGIAVVDLLTEKYLASGLWFVAFSAWGLLTCRLAMQEYRETTREALEDIRRLFKDDRDGEVKP